MTGEGRVRHWVSRGVREGFLEEVTTGLSPKDKWELATVCKQGAGAETCQGVGTGSAVEAEGSMKWQLWAR